MDEVKKTSKKKVIIIAAVIAAVIAVVLFFTLGSSATFSVDEINWDLGIQQLEEECDGKLIEKAAGTLSYEYDSFEGIVDCDITANYFYTNVNAFSGDGGELDNISIYISEATDENAKKIIDHFNMEEDSQDKGVYYKYTEDLVIRLDYKSELMPDKLHIHISKR